MTATPVRRVPYSHGSQSVPLTPTCRVRTGMMFQLVLTVGIWFVGLMVSQPRAATARQGAASVL